MSVALLYPAHTERAWWPYKPVDQATDGWARESDYKSDPTPMTRYQLDPQIRAVSSSQNEIPCKLKS